MTREEKIKRLKALKSRCERLIMSSDRGPEEWRKDAEALDLALTALCGPTRKRVEKVWKGEWEWYDEEVGSPLEGIDREWGWRCSKCKAVLPDDFDDPDNPPAMRFCQWCGAPMTDEAVDMVMEKLEAMHNDL